MKDMPIGQVLVELNYITEAQLKEALNYQRSHPGRLKIGDALIELKMVTQEQLMEALANKLRVEYVDLEDYKINKTAAMMLPEDFARRNKVLVIDMVGDTVLLATDDPMNFYKLEDVRLIMGYSVKPVAATEKAIKETIDKIYSTSVTTRDVMDNLNREFEGDSVPDSRTLDNAVDEDVSNAPIVKLVNSIISQAIKLGASDIHIEPMADQTQIRMRVDGKLHDEMHLNAHVHKNLIARLKIVSGMDISNNRVPQDGRVEFKVDNNSIDLRVSSLPVVYGEKIVMRILGSSNSIMPIESLGFNTANKTQFEKFIHSSQGMILVCGPTGSGKSTTLYSMLNYINNPSLNTITVEDPVEFKVSGINQVQVNNKAGMTFAAALKSILRQDPDIIMVGEIRDSETANIAAKAAITGHLVLSTIHTRDASSTIPRLINMGVEPYMVSTSVSGVIAQRLVRKLCPYCKQPHMTDEWEMKCLGITEPREIYGPHGCSFCNHLGFKGRIPIHEIIAVSSGMRALIDNNATADELRKYAAGEGAVTLQDNCREHVFNGIVSFDEFISSTYTI